MARPSLPPAAGSGADEEARDPNLAALRRLEVAQHVRRAMAMGMPRNQANAHARRAPRDGGRAKHRLLRHAARHRTGSSL